MRVLVDYRPALRQPTGVGAYVHQLIRALVAGGGPASGAADRVTAFAASWKDRPSAGQLADLAPAAFVDRRIPVRLLTWTWNRLDWPAIEHLAGPFDVVHAATPVGIPTRAAAQVLTIHDLHFLRHPERTTAEMRRDFPALVRARARDAAAIVVSSAYTAADVCRTLEVPADKVFLCQPGPPAWAGEVRARRAQSPPAHVLFVGTLDPRKNIGVLLDAYAALRARHPQAPPLVMAGGIPATAREWQTRAAAPDLAPHVQMPGYVGESTRRNLYAGAHMLVLPSLDEGFGLPVLEAMACGVPVVVSSGGALPEVAGPDVTPVAPDDVEGFAAAMARLLDPEAAAAAAAAGLAHAAAFDWRTCAEGAWRAYRFACERRR